MHVDDVGAALVALLNSNVRGAVNIGSGTGLTVREVVQMIGAVTGHAELIEFGALSGAPRRAALARR